MFQTAEGASGRADKTPKNSLNLEIDEVEE